MKDFIKATLTAQKLRKLFVSTALGNFAGYTAGSLVTVLFTYRSVERRAVKNLFGLLPRKEVVVHVLPEWLEWLIALLVGFLVMEFVRYSINKEKYEQMLPTAPRETPSTPSTSSTSDRA